MVALYQGLGIVHIAVAALVVAGFVLSLMNTAVSPLMVWAARVQLVLGLVLVGLAEGGGILGLNHSWVAVKLIVAIGVVACVEIASKRAARGERKRVLLYVAVGLTLVNILYAYAG